MISLTFLLLSEMSELTPAVGDEALMETLKLDHTLL